MKDKNQLTIKQERFVQEYMKGGDASAAYRVAYDSKNMKPESVNRTAHALLENLKIASRVKELREADEKRNEITRDKVLKELARLAFLDISKAYDENGHMKSIHDIDEDTRRAIGGIKVADLFEGYGEDRKKIGEIKELKLADKKGALDSIAKLQGWVIDKKEITGRNGGKIEVTSETIRTYQNEEEAERAHRDLLKDS